MLLSGTRLVIFGSRIKRVRARRCRGDSPEGGCVLLVDPKHESEGCFCSLFSEVILCFCGVFGETDERLSPYFQPFGTAARKPCKEFPESYVVVVTPV